MTKISPHFTHEELADPQTQELVLATGFIEELETLRVLYDHAMIVKDGCRSDAYNNWLIERGYPASPTSFHLIKNPKWKTGGCCALDIKRPDAVKLAMLVSLALSRVWSVGIGKTFVHLDRRVDYTSLSNVLYIYN